MEIGYNKQLAFYILTRLNEAFPIPLQLEQLQDTTSEFSALSEQEWIVATHALIKLGHATAGLVRSGMSDIPELMANIEITGLGQQWLREANAEPGENSGELDDLLPIFAKRQFLGDFKALVAKAGDIFPVSLVMTDLDHFKAVNDNFGHSTGDQVLLGVASVIKAACYGKGRCYRWGGDELAILLPNYSPAEAMILAERMRGAVSHLEFKDYKEKLTLISGDH